MNKWMGGGKKEGRNEAMNEGKKGWMMEREKEGMKGGRDECMHARFVHACMNEWTNERTNERMNESRMESRKEENESINRSKNERTKGWVSYFFVELLLCWATSLLSYFTEPPRPWGASSFSSSLSSLSSGLLFWPASALSCFPLSATSSARSLCGPISPFARPALCVLHPPGPIWSRIAQEWHYASLCWTTTVFAAATVFSNLQLQSRKAGALQTPVFNHFKMQIELKLQSRALFVGYLLMWLPWWCGWPDGWHDLDPSAQTPISGFEYI